MLLEWLVTTVNIFWGSFFSLIFLTLTMEDDFSTSAKYEDCVWM